jgi:hypothetical protein
VRAADGQRTAPHRDKFLGRHPFQAGTRFLPLRQGRVRGPFALWRPMGSVPYSLTKWQGNCALPGAQPFSTRSNPPKPVQTRFKPDGSRFRPDWSRFKPVILPSTSTSEPGWFGLPFLNCQRTFPVGPGKIQSALRANAPGFAVFRTPSQSRTAPTPPIRAYPATTCK